MTVIPAPGASPGEDNLTSNKGLHRQPFCGDRINGIFS